ncbi:diphosphomevalonate/mevalonate 3,5-bisphosphate decarboxylase family protein [Borrelia miyamotoi]|uniref:Diphosphomevalonate decarboxylase n=1 Tax=Borrelia miyamotoi TaxID=47466 RepID=A0AAQ3AGD0_9SPIR|nr:diphosphomevalonate decarboxylase [Borrelia miyamotoi]AGT27630.1 diphosphomevalonate decarboxylase [Borrelia miyamotoi LB-2001]AJA58793.1 diphosphomevalonate decarboxylase [Borrelia miyamotoi]AOW95878.1 diphosphomevalonate decarboxylase [Borrelia miyamotoi]QTL83770.1 diphosphomevalonate decarboxylase [Borrelia miyamotoi]WAZ84924.1 diphosphomevalonate decarboxylase [Borrelia miyamotoi]
MKVRCKVNPSLALIKYWGKRDKFLNVPATSSIAVSIDKFHSVSEIELSCKDEIILNSNTVVLKDREIKFFNYARKILNEPNICFRVISENNFPTAAGLASSSSGFASIAACILRYFNQYSHQKASDLARIGSASAARAIYGGFTFLKEGAKSAFQVNSFNCFNDLCIIFAIVDSKEKEISSRVAMEICKQEEFYWNAWVKASRTIFKDALYFFLKGNFNEFGLKIVKSYQCMFGLMLSSSIIYFKGITIDLIKYIANLRNKGILIFETMDAGPQVKILCLQRDLEFILNELTRNFTDVDFVVSRIGIGLEWI